MVQNHTNKSRENLIQSIIYLIFCLQYLYIIYILHNYSSDAKKSFYPHRNSDRYRDFLSWNPSDSLDHG